MAWAARPDGSKLARLAGDRLLLFDDAGCFILDVNIPLAAKRIEAPGTFVGLAGRVACILSAEGLLALDIASGEARLFTLRELTGGKVNARLRVALDGHLVYAMGTGGILGLNVRTGQRAFKADWPEAAATADGIEPQVQYLRHGAYVADSAGAYHVQAPVDLAADGVLYATVTPTRVAALVQAAGDGG
jgi:hypothetical protein